MNILELKSILIDMKNQLQGLNWQMWTGRKRKSKRIRKHVDRSIEIMQSEEEREKNKGKWTKHWKNMGHLVVPTYKY